MKCNILTVVISAPLVAGVANAAEVYNKDDNRIDMYNKAISLHYFSRHNGEDAYAVDGDQTYARLDFKGEIQTNDQLIDYGQWEYQSSGSNSEGGSDAQNGNKTRLVFAGLKFGDAGSFDHGRSYGIAYDTLGYTDMLPEFGGDAAAPDQLLSQHNGGLATCRNANSFGLIEDLNFAAQYLGKNGRDDICRSNGDDVGGSISYEFDGFGIVGAYGAANRIDIQQNPVLRSHGDKTEQWAIDVKYDANDIYLVAGYSETRSATRISNGYANKTKGVLLVAQYQLSFDLRPPLVYAKSRGKDIEGVGDVDLVNYFGVDTTYYFNRNMPTYVDYIINRIGSNNKLGMDSDDTVAVGITYQF